MNHDEPLDALRRLEGRLQTAPSLRFHVRLRSGELVTTHLEGVVELGPSNRVQMELRGEWESLPATLEPSDDQRRIVGDVRGRRIDYVVPKGFRDSLAVGFVRLGLLEMVFRIVDGAGLRSGDALRRQLRLDALAVLEPEPTRPDLSACLGNAFTIRDRGRDMATATLWIDQLDDHPQERSQWLRMAVPMGITELYWDWRE
jgi:hypothetical protein